MAKYRITWKRKTRDLVDIGTKGIKYIETEEVDTESIEDALNKLVQTKPNYVKFSRIEKL